MRITSKGQITIPVEIRERMGLLPDTEVEFSVRGNVVVLKKACTSTRRGEKIIRTMRGSATTRMTTDQIMALTRDE